MRSQQVSESLSRWKPSNIVVTWLHDRMCANSQFVLTFLNCSELPSRNWNVYCHNIPFGVFDNVTIYNLLEVFVCDITCSASKKTKHYLNYATSTIEDYNLKIKCVQSLHIKPNKNTFLTPPQIPMSLTKWITNTNPTKWPQVDVDNILVKNKKLKPN